MRTSFIEHPRPLGQNCGKRLTGVTEMGLSLSGAGYACLIHALLPILFIDTVGPTVPRAQHRLVVVQGRLVDNKDVKVVVPSVTGEARDRAVSDDVLA